jgi:GDPmannose 4,6-dehydratase
VRVSFDIQEYTVDVPELRMTRLLEAVRTSGVKIKFYQASLPE